jgi:GH25 family lysozyme M1 (1,4-beta-N-acetylmuramidase)
MRGIDLSHWNKVQDWNKIKNDDINFCFLKTSQGINLKDSKFEEYKKASRNIGLLTSFYHFADGGDPIAEADFFLKTVGDIQEGEILVLDWEINHSSPADWCLKFLNRCLEKTGIRPLLYTNEARVKSIDWFHVVNNNFGLWIARYYLNTGYKMPLVSPSSGQWPFWAIWQFTSRGKVDGIIGFVDLNYTKMDIATLRKYGKTTNEPFPSSPENGQESKLYPLKDWKTAKRGYKFAEKTWYNSRHIGLDVIVPKGTPVYAWRDVEITFAQYGYQGGYQCWVKDKGKLVRFLHLMKKPVIGKYKSGQIIAYTGNTGALTSSAHAHLDCSKNGKLELNNFSNFQDPEEYFR